MRSGKLLGIVIGGSLGGLFFAFVMIVLFCPGIFLSGIIKERLGKTFGGKLRVEDVNFGWRRGLELSNFILAQREERSMLQAGMLRLKFAPLSLLSGRYVLRNLGVSDLVAMKGFGAGHETGINVLGLRASKLTFNGKLNMPATTLKDGNRPVGGGHIRLEDGFLTGELVSLLMESLGQSGGGYAFESISTNFETEREGQLHLKNFLARGELFDLEMEGTVHANQKLDCDAMVIPKEKVGKKAEKFFKFSGADTLRIPIRLKGGLSRPKISIKAESLVEEMFRGIFQEK